MGAARGQPSSSPAARARAHHTEVLVRRLGPSVVLLVHQLGERAPGERVAIQAREAIDVEVQVLEQDGLVVHAREPRHEPGLASREGVFRIRLHLDAARALQDAAAHRDAAPLERCQRSGQREEVDALGRLHDVGAGTASPLEAAAAHQQIGRLAHRRPPDPESAGERGLRWDPASRAVFPRADAGEQQVRELVVEGQRRFRIERVGHGASVRGAGRDVKTTYPISPITPVAGSPLRQSRAFGPRRPTRPSRDGRKLLRFLMQLG